MSVDVGKVPGQSSQSCHVAYMSDTLECVRCSRCPTGLLQQQHVENDGAAAHRCLPICTLPGPITLTPVEPGDSMGSRSGLM
jgi:hypothetical protein